MEVINLDPNNPVNGEIVETPAGSPPETITPGGETTVNPQDAGSLSPEEENWNSLKGSTQDRIKQIIREKNDWIERAERAEQLANSQPVYQTQQPTYSNPNPNSPEVVDAVKKLSDVGIATKDEVEQRINQTVNGLVREMELDRLEAKYSGENGLPKFDKEEYRDYINRHPQYQYYMPDDVYNKMYSEEILDWKLQNQGQAATTKPSPSLRPTKTRVGEEVLTPELIDQRLKEPDGRAWYERNIEKINAVMYKQTPTE